MKKLHGFTLIELMVAVAIIGILTSLAIPAYRDYIFTSRMTVANTHMEQLRLFQEVYKLSNDTYVAGVMNGQTGIFNNTIGFFPGDEGDLFIYSVTNCNVGSSDISECFLTRVEYLDNPDHYVEVESSN